MKNSWNTFWFSEAPYFDLALLRIMVVGFSLIYLFSYSYDNYHYVMSLPDSMWLPFPALKILMLPFGWGARPDPILLHWVFWLTIISGAGALVGLLTNFNLFIFAVGNVFLQTYIYAFGDSHHREAIMVITLMVFAFSPCGKLLSIDSIIRRKRLPAGHQHQISMLEYKGVFAGWPIKLMQCFFPLMYLSAVTSKLTMGGLDWANGFTLQYYLIQDGTRHGTNLPILAAQYHELIKILQYVVLLFQATFFLIVPFPKLRWIYLPLGFFFHTGIWLTLGAPFPQWIFLYSLYIPWSQVIKATYECQVYAREDRATGAAGA